MATRLNPYIQFKDESKDALAFYHSVFGGELTMMTFGQMGVEGIEAEKIMHGQLVTDAGHTIMASDTPDHLEHTPGGTITISLSGDDAEAMRTWFAGLSEGGDVTLPLTVQMWGDEFGMVTDRFGVRWMCNIATAQAQVES